MTVETLPPVRPELMHRPKGRYTVELFDAATGELEDRMSFENYITPLYEKHMAGYQYLSPWWKGNLPNNSVLLFPSSSQTNVANPNGPFLSQSAARLWNPYGVPALPMDALILTDDATAEDTSETWLKGRIAAWAMRYKRTVPASGTEGLINESESTLSNNGLTHKTVWDFTTQQGNGTFQTLAIGSIITVGDHTTRKENAFWTAMGPKSIWLGSRAPAPGATVVYGMHSNIWDDGTNLYWLQAVANSTSSAIGIYSTPRSAVFGAPAHATDPFVQDASGSAPTLVCTLPATVGNYFTPNNASYPAINTPGLASICRIPGGDFLIATIGSAANSYVTYLRRFTAAGVQVWATNPLPVGATAANRNVGCAYDGTHMFVTVFGENGLKSNMYRINVSTGALDATIPLPSNLEVASGFNLQLGYDGTNLFVGTDVGICEITTAGAFVQAYGMLGRATSFGTAVAPWDTTVSAQRSIGRRESGVMAAAYGGWESNPSNRISTNLDASASGDLNHPNRQTGALLSSLGPCGFLFDGGKMWVACAYMAHPEFAGSNGPAGLIAVTGANMFSRAVLDTPITKNTSQNMKITYELTWPGHTLASYPEHRSY